MKKILLLAVLALAVFGLVKVRISHANQGSGTGRKSCDVPKAWGMYKGSIGTTFVFEDGSGVIRAVDGMDCRTGRLTVDFEVHRN